jgi:hypothetical protein
MYSHIGDAWENDPIKEMTNKLEKGIFKINTDQSDVFRFNNSSSGRPITIPSDMKSLSLSDQNSLSLASDNSLSPDITNCDTNPFRNRNRMQYYDRNMSPYAPVHFDRYSGKKKSFSRYIDPDSDDDDYFDSESDRFTRSRCSYSIKHLKKCDRCYDKLKDLINARVNKKMDEIILDTKLKQIQSMPMQNTSPSYPQPQHATNPDAWKEMAVIIIGAIMAMFIIFLIVRAISK